MNRKITLIMGLLGLGAALGFATAKFLPGDGAGTTVSGEKKVLYWVAPMDPNYRSDEPGKSPMGMDLVPVYEGEEPGRLRGAGSAEPFLRINPAVVNNLGVRTAPVERGMLHRPISTVGFVVPNDELRGHVHIRTEGWIEELFVKTVGETVASGDLLFRMYAPVLVNAQAEYLQALRLGNTVLAAAARERLVALGMTREQVGTVAKTRKVEQLIDVRAHHRGTVLQLGVAEGMFVRPEDTILDIADLSSVWVMAEVYENQAAWVEEGQRAAMQLAFAPGRTWEGAVDYVYPTVDPKSRTVRVRLVFDNPDRALKPNMYADITIGAAPKRDILHIPRMALIRTSNAERVILALGDGRFRPAQVVAGMETGERVEIIKGLKPGEQVVVSGQFLIDSEASLDASLLRLATGAEDRLMNGTARPPGAAAAIAGTGRVTAVDAENGQVTLAHDPIPDIGWPAMTMGFSIGAGLAGRISAGDRVEFQMTEMPGGSYRITAIDKISAGDGADGTP